MKEQQKRLPEPGFTRLRDIVNDPGSPKVKPPKKPPKKPRQPRLGIIPVSRSHWWDGVKRGIYPKPVKLSPRCTAWRNSDLNELLSRLSNGGAA